MGLIGIRFAADDSTNYGHCGNKRRFVAAGLPVAKSGQIPGGGFDP